MYKKVAYNVGGIPLQIKHGKTGFLVPVGKTEEVATTLFRLLTDQNLYETITNNLRKDFHNEYLTPVQLIKWNEIFKSLLLTENN